VGEITEREGACHHGGGEETPSALVTLSCFQRFHAEETRGIEGRRPRSAVMSP